MQSLITQLWRDKLDVLFPRSCVHCGGVVEGGRLRHLCPACEKLLFVVEPPHCTTCGHVKQCVAKVDAKCSNLRRLHVNLSENVMSIA